MCFAAVRLPQSLGPAQRRLSGTSAASGSAREQHLKQLMLARAGLKPTDSLKFELDHFVPLALGGHPRSEDNLWLQSRVGEWSARVKDRLERNYGLAEQ